MKKVGYKVEISNRCLANANNKGFRFVVLSLSQFTDYLPDNLKVSLYQIPGKNIKCFYALTYKNGSSYFFLEANNCVYLFDRANEAIDFEYDFEKDEFCYLKSGVWYRYMPKEDNDVLLGEKLLPHVFIRHGTQNSFIVTQESISIHCKSYKLASDESGKDVVLLSDVDKRREYFAIIDGKNHICRCDDESIILFIDGKSQRFLPGPINGLWVTPEKKTPEMLW